jgi:hypothetical protein
MFSSPFSSTVVFAQTSEKEESAVRQRERESERERVREEEKTDGERNP